MAATDGILLFPPWWTSLDDNGELAVGAKLRFYLSGTTTPATVYHDAARTSAWAVPATTDMDGRIVVYADPAVGNLKLIVTDANNVSLGPTVDPVTVTSSGLIGGSIGDVFVFGGQSSFPVTATSYPSGATFDKLHPGTAVMPLNTLSLAAGSYTIQATGVVASAAFLSVGIVNLTDGSPDTPLMETVISSLTGETVTGSSMTLAIGGVTKQYGIKTKITTASGGAWGVRMIRTA